MTSNPKAAKRKPRPPELPTDYCPQCCVEHVTCECPHEGESYRDYWRRMDRLAEERAQ